jgi:hypothetical protein
MTVDSRATTALFSRIASETSPLYLMFILKCGANLEFLLQQASSPAREAA